MKVYDITDKDGNIFAFELGNFFLSRKRLSSFISRIPGVKVVHTSFEKDEFCEFELNGDVFSAEEPFGDNSRIWIGPKIKKSSLNLSAIRDFFRHKRLFF